MAGTGLGFAQTIEQSCGLAFLTGYEGEAPLIPNGMCDPLAGAHGAIAASGPRSRSETAAAPGWWWSRRWSAPAWPWAAEQVVEHSAFGRLQRSMGNSSPLMLQGVFRCAGDDDWLAVSVPDQQARQAAQDVAGGISPAELERWCAARSAEDAARELWAGGVPAARVQWAHEIVDSPQLQHRGSFEQLDHPLCGKHTYISWPARFSAGPPVWNRVASPTMGQHNGEILAELGFDEGEIGRMRRQGVISEGVLTDQHGW